MTAIGQGRERAAVARLRHVTRVDPYAGNPFRITGLRTDASGRSIREQRQQMTIAMKLGKVPAGDSRMPPRSAPTSEDVAAAFQEIVDAETRLVDELFWWWDSPGACGCSTSLHDEHDAAVYVHALALEREANGEDPARCEQVWIVAGQAWSDVLRKAQFWDHVRHRISELGDRRLDESTVDGLREAMPRAVLNPLVALAESSPDPGRLLGYLRHWQVSASAQDELLAGLVQPDVERLRSLLTEVGNQLAANHLATAAKLAANELVGVANRIERVRPHRQHRDAARDRNLVAIILNNCALRMVETSHQWTAPQPGTLYALAEQLATDPETRNAIQINLIDQQITEQVIPLIMRRELSAAIEKLEKLRAMSSDLELQHRINILRNRINTLQDSMQLAQSYPHRYTNRQLSVQMWAATAAVVFFVVAVIGFFLLIFGSAEVGGWMLGIGISLTVLIRLSVPD